MMRLLAAVLLLLPMFGLCRAQTESVNEPHGGFAVIEVWIDVGVDRLAAYQVDIAAVEETALIVGIEGGNHPAFAEPPFYDPDAMQNDRVIIGAFDVSDDDLPTGRTRVASIHIEYSGERPPAFRGTIDVLATVDGRRITGALELTELLP